MGRKRVSIDSKFQSKKSAKRCLGDDDRISRFPDDILIDILSFLPSKEAARTSVLSFRWLNLWKHTSRLNFNDIAVHKTAMERDIRTRERREYANWVNYVLRSHKAVALKEFRICFDLSSSYEKTITKWLTYVFSRQVERLELDFSSVYPEGMFSPTFGYAFPKEFLNQTQSNGIGSPSDTSRIHHPLVDFKSLKALSLISVNVTSEAIEFFLHNCPVLGQLAIHNTNAITKLEICGPSLMLKHLEICYCYYLKSIKVSAPNLVSLKVTTLWRLILENVPMLVEVYIVSQPYDAVYFKNILPALSCISQLKIRTTLLGRPEESNDSHEFPGMPNLKKLVIECVTISSDKSVIALTSLIRAAPYLQEFVFKLYLDCISSSGSEVKNTIRFPHQHLKVVKFCGYYCCASDVELMRYFWDNCVVLEKVIIGRNDHYPRWNPHSVREETASNLAKQQLEAEVPEHIELVFL